MSREAKALLSDVDTSRGVSPVPTTSHAVGARVEARYRATVLGKMGTKWFAASVRAVHGDGSYDVLYDDGDEENGVLAQFVRAPKLKATAPQAPPPPPASSRASSKRGMQTRSRSGSAAKRRFSRPSSMARAPASKAPVSPPTPGGGGDG